VVHHAYPKHAEVTVSSLDDWEKQWKQNSQDMQKPNGVTLEFQTNQTNNSCPQDNQQPADSSHKRELLHAREFAQGAI
jgi:hypothetical protein